MNRRGFLGTFGAMAAALTLDPERLLWRPKAKTIFIPKFYEATVTVDLTPTYYGWVQTNGQCEVFYAPITGKFNDSFPRIEELIEKFDMSRGWDCQEMGPNTYVYIKRVDSIKRGSIVTFNDNCTDEVRLAGPGDKVLGVAL